jgi:hypothetical protein
MQKVEGSSPFSRLERPANAGLCRSPAGWLQDASRNRLPNGGVHSIVDPRRDQWRTRAAAFATASVPADRFVRPPPHATSM